MQDFTGSQGVNLPFTQTFGFNGFPPYESFLGTDAWTSSVWASPSWYLPFLCVEDDRNIYERAFLSSSEVPSDAYYFWRERLYWRRFVTKANRELEEKCREKPRHER
jgi:hypothetical protein